MELFIEQIDNEILRDKKRRQAEGYSVERRGDRRSILFSYGQVEFERTYYKKASGGYEYLADTAAGINERDRISENMLCSLAAGAKDMSYENASRHITGGKISRQTVMNCVRESRAEATESTEKRAVSETAYQPCFSRKDVFPTVSMERNNTKAFGADTCSR